MVHVIFANRSALDLMKFWPPYIVQTLKVAYHLMIEGIKKINVKIITARSLRKLKRLTSKDD
jgi:hypothetical protein